MNALKFTSSFVFDNSLCFLYDHDSIVCFMKQTVVKSYGTIRLLHAVGNITSDVKLGKLLIMYEFGVLFLYSMRLSCDQRKLPLSLMGYSFG